MNKKIGITKNTPLAQMRASLKNKSNSEPYFLSKGKEKVEPTDSTVEVKFLAKEHEANEHQNVSSSHVKQESSECPVDEKTYSDKRELVGEFDTSDAKDDFVKNEDQIASFVNNRETENHLTGRSHLSKESKKREGSNKDQTVVDNGETIHSVADRPRSNKRQYKTEKIKKQSLQNMIPNDANSDNLKHSKNSRKTALNKVMKPKHSNSLGKISTSIALKKSKKVEIQETASVSQKEKRFYKSRRNLEKQPLKTTDSPSELRRMSPILTRSQKGRHSKATSLSESIDTDETAVNDEQRENTPMSSDEDFDLTVDCDTRKKPRKKAPKMEDELTNKVDTIEELSEHCMYLAITFKYSCIVLLNFLSIYGNWECECFSKTVQCEYLCNYLVNSFRKLLLMHL